MKPKFRPTLGDLKKHLICSLCSEYLTEAATINKCLHSFCHRCIVRHLATSNSCPTCHKVLHPRRPLSKIRRDRTLQRLVYKTVPGLLKRTEVNESSRELDPDLSDPLFPSNDYFSIRLEQKSRGSEIGPLTRIADSVLSLVSDDHKIDEPRYLFCAAVMKLKILKKFLSFKFDLSSRYEIGMMCCNELFDDDCTLLDVAYISRWTVAEPLKLEYLILDREKLIGIQDEETAEPAVDILPDGHPSPMDSPPQPASEVSADLPSSDVKCSSVPNEPPDLNATVAAPVSTELGPSVPSTPPESSNTRSNGTAKKKRGRKPKSSEGTKIGFDETHPEEKDDRTRLDSVVQSELASLGANTNAKSAADVASGKRRGRKRKSDSVHIAAPLDEKADDLQSKKRSSRFSCRYNEGVVSVEVSNENPDTTTTKKAKTSASSDEPLVPDPLVPETPSCQDGDKQPAKAEHVSLSGEGRVGTLKKSLNGQKVRNETGQREHSNLRLDEETKQRLDDDLTKGQYRLKIKDDLRVHLSRTIKTSRLRDDEDISKQKLELPGDRKKKSHARKTAQAPQKTRKRVEAVKNEVATHLDDNDYLKVTPQRSEKKSARVVQKLSSGDCETSKTDLSGKSSVIRKKRTPSITETPSPVVYDTDIETLPYLNASSDKKVPRFLGRKSILEKIPKAVSISTIPPTFVLAASRKPGNHGRDKAVDGRQPVPLKVYLRMVDERKLSVAHDRTDDCFMVSSTVADDDAELAGAGSGNSVDGSPGSGTCAGRAPLGNGIVPGCAEEQSRLQSSVSSELPQLGDSISDSRSLVCPGESPAACDAPRPPPCVETNAAGLAQKSKLLVSSPGGVPSGKMDRGLKRKRLESVISSLKPVASVVVSTDLMQPALPSQPIIPAISAAARDSSAGNKFCPPATLSRNPEKPNDTTPSLLHRLVSREPLNIPVPPMRHQWQTSRAAVCPLAGFPPGSQYPVRAQGQFREPRNAQRQHYPRAPRRASVGQQVRAARYPTATNAHIAAAAYAMGLLQVNRTTRPPVFNRGWTPEQEQRLRFLAGAGGMRQSVVQTRFPQPNGYDAPLELTTKKSRDLTA